MSVWTHKLLDQLRQMGDPALDSVREDDGWRRVRVAPPDEGSASLEVRLLKAWRRNKDGALPEDVDHEDAGDAFWTAWTRPMSPARLATAHSLFVSYGGEIGATLLLASLPHAYAAEAGAAVLATTRELQSNARRRIGETAQFVVDVLFPDPTPLYESGFVAGPDPQGLPPASRGYVRVLTTRLTHAVIRSQIAARAPWDPTDSAKVPRREATKRGVPINQEDLLGALGTFTVTVFETMEKLGVPWNDEAEQAYLDLWDCVGALLGIGTVEITDRLREDGFELPEEYHGRLRPKTPAEARELATMIRERSWPVAKPGRELAPFANANGKVLTRALLDELQEAMPRGMERVPLHVMRYLVDEPAHELLGLGGGGLPDSLLRLPREQRLTRLPGRRMGRGMVEMAMRLTANDISRRAFVHFIRQRAADEEQSDFWFPVVADGAIANIVGRGGVVDVPKGEPAPEQAV